MPLFDDSGFDFDDFVRGGDLIDFDLGSIDFGVPDSYGGFDFDLSSLPNFGFDLSNLGSFDERGIGDLAGFGLDVGLDTTFDPFEVDGFQGSRDDKTALVGLHTDAEAQEGGFYGNTKNADYDPKTNVTTIRDDQGNIIRTVQGPPVPGIKGTNPFQQFIDRVSGPGPNKKDALLISLLGGLMGLLGKKSGVNKGPVGYKGEIPKYTAVRGPTTSPTAGGRRPGGAGIGSLAGTTRYVPAAAGGLMGLKKGRYLEGKTDGMADKIQTNIDGKQPARLSHGEFVIPADVVSHLGNGNSDAGADVLYEMMDKVRMARTGNKKQGRQINPRKYTPA